MQGHRKRKEKRRGDIERKEGRRGEGRVGGKKMKEECCGAS